MWFGLNYTKKYIKAYLVVKKKLKILIAQPEPGNTHSPFHDLADKHNVKIVFNPFLSIEGETVKNIRIKKINISKW